MTSKIYVHTSFIEAPLLQSISTNKDEASETIFDFLIAYFDYQSRAVVHQGDDRYTLWKCCSRTVQAIIQFLYLKRMEKVHSGQYIQLQQELDAEEPRDDESDDLHVLKVDTKPRQFGRKILSTAADGDALYAQIKAAADGLSKTPTRESAPAPRARMAERRERMRVYRAELDKKWALEIQTDEVMEDEFVYRYGPSNLSEALAYLGKVHMPRAQNNADAFKDVSAIINFRIVFERALSWCRNEEFNPEVLKVLLTKNIQPSALRNIISNNTSVCFDNFWCVLSTEYDKYYSIIRALDAVGIYDEPPSARTSAALAIPEETKVTRFAPSALKNARVELLEPQRTAVVCTFCQRTGHDEAQCFTKKRQVATTPAIKQFSSALPSTPYVPRQTQPSAAPGSSYRVPVERSSQDARRATPPMGPSAAPGPSHSRAQVEKSSQDAPGTPPPASSRAGTSPIYTPRASSQDAQGSSKQLSGPDLHSATVPQQPDGSKSSPAPPYQFDTDRHVYHSSARLCTGFIRVMTPVRHTSPLPVPSPSSAAMAYTPKQAPQSSPPASSRAETPPRTPHRAPSPSDLSSQDAHRAPQRPERLLPSSGLLIRADTNCLAESAAVTLVRLFRQQCPWVPCRLAL